MPRFAANLSLLYNEFSFIDRFAAAAADGFTAVECLLPYAFAPEVLAEQLQRHRLQLVLFNAAVGNWDAGERGLLCLPERESDFRQGVLKALAYAQALETPRLHLMCGLLPAGERLDSLRSLLLRRISWAADQAAAVGCNLCLEPINARDMPGYALNWQNDAIALIQALNHPALGLQFDVYHCQVTEGDVSRRLQHAHALGVLAHVQIAGAPDRHEPDEGELRVEHLLTLLDEIGYQGFVGCEYRPRARTSDGLGWIRRWLPAP